MLSRTFSRFDKMDVDFLFLEWLCGNQSEAVSASNHEEPRKSWGNGPDVGARLRANTAFAQYRVARKRVPTLLNVGWNELRTPTTFLSAM